MEERTRKKTKEGKVKNVDRKKGRTKGNTEGKKRKEWKKLRMNKSMNRWRTMAGVKPKKESRRKHGRKRSCVDAEVEWR